MTAAPAGDRLAMTVAFRTGPQRVELNALAAEWFDTDSPVEPERFRTLGADVPAVAGPLGGYLLERLLEPGPAATELIGAGDACLVASFEDGTCTLYAVAPPVRSHTAERERRHALRNQINTINMNAELIEVLAARADDTRIRECAARIAEACRQAAATIER